MELKLYLRVEFNTYIRNKLISDSCEVCGDTENLHLHHEEHFITMLLETIEELGLKFVNDKDYYSKNELSLISNIMLGKQVRSSYVTLCTECHKEIHSKEGKDWTNFYLHYEKKALEKRSKHLKTANEILIPYLEYLNENNVRLVGGCEGARMIKKSTYENRDKLINLICRCSDTKQAKTAKTLNKILDYLDIKYNINSHSTGGYRYWVVRKTQTNN